MYQSEQKIAGILKLLFEVIEEFGFFAIAGDAKLGRPVDIVPDELVNCATSIVCVESSLLVFLFRSGFCSRSVEIIALGVFVFVLFSHFYKQPTHCGNCIFRPQGARVEVNVENLVDELSFKFCESNSRVLRRFDWTRPFGVVLGCHWLCCYFISCVGGSCTVIDCCWFSC